MFGFFAFPPAAGPELHVEKNFLKKNENFIKEKFVEKNFDFLSRPPMSVHKKCQPNRSSGSQGYNAEKVNCSCVYSAYISKPVLSGRNL